MAIVKHRMFKYIHKEYICMKHTHNTYKIITNGITLDSQD